MHWNGARQLSRAAYHSFVLNGKKVIESVSGNKKLEHFNKAERKYATIVHTYLAESEFTNQHTHVLLGGAPLLWPPKFNTKLTKSNRPFFTRRRHFNVIFRSTKPSLKERTKNRIPTISTVFEFMNRGSTKCSARKKCMKYENWICESIYCAVLVLMWKYSALERGINDHK